jgi:hypothetical protein
MVVPIDRAARPEAEPGEAELSLPAFTTPFAAIIAAAHSRWLRIGACLLTAVLLFPILCLALFPVSILALVGMPLAGLVYAGSLGLRPQNRSRSASGASKSDSISVSRAA